MISAIGVALLAAAVSSKVSRRLNLPILVAFLGFGMLLKNLDPGIDPKYINHLGTVAMSFILFSGGLETRYTSIKAVFAPGAILATFGVVITGLILGVGTYFVFRLPWIQGEYPLSWCLVLGAVISSTDASSVFAILRGKGVGLKGRLRDLLEFESGSNDPMAYCLTIIMLSFALGESVSGFASVVKLIWAMGGGCLIGYAIGRAGKWIFHFEVEYEGLYFVFIVALVLCSYGLAELILANGMMACYVAGVTMNHRRFNYQRSASRFCDGITWLLQVVLFVTLGLVSGGSALLSKGVLIPGILLSLILMFAARPAAVFLCLSFFKRPFKQKLLISWVGLRGAAPIVLATFPLAKDLPGAEIMFDMIFFMVLTSIVVQGSTLMSAAKFLQQDRQTDTRSRLPLELEVTKASSGSDMYEFAVTGDSVLAGKTLAEAGFPAETLVMMIRRGEELISPRGNTDIRIGDGLLIMAKHKTLQQLAKDFFPGNDYE